MEQLKTANKMLFYNSARLHYRSNRNTLTPFGHDEILPWQLPYSTRLLVFYKYRIYYQNNLTKRMLRHKLVLIDIDLLHHQTQLQLQANLNWPVNKRGH